ncbi:MAG: polysaccharide pyruvyl transferase family protein [Sphingomonadaceae bacterium]
MTSVLIRGFPSLDNYGTGMMGLVTIDRLARRIEGPIAFHCDLAAATDPDEIRAELDCDPAQVTLHRWQEKREAGALAGLKRLAGTADVKGHDLVVMLGGDDISEYYYKGIWRTMVRFARQNMTTPVVLLGQTIGPFARPANRLAARLFLSRAAIYPRDRWCTAYLAREFGMGANLFQSTDLALGDLPLQHRRDIEAETLARFGLEPDGYATVVVSALQKAGYYTSDRDAYLGAHARLVEQLLSRADMAGKKLVLLAHTFGIYGAEADYVAQVAARVPEALQPRLVLVTERILQTRARFVLGNGLFTVTGRMHPAVSTFQMGRPAIALAYSKKYEGVIGTMIGRGDLIVDANDPALWADGAIVERVLEKVDHVMADMPRLRREIAKSVAAQKQLVEQTFDHLAGRVWGKP